MIVPLLLLVGHVDAYDIHVLLKLAGEASMGGECTLTLCISETCCWYAFCALALLESNEVSVFFRLFSTS